MNIEHLYGIYVKMEKRNSLEGDSSGLQPTTYMNPNIGRKQ
jgi:hypothetical protein